MNLTTIYLILLLLIIFYAISMLFSICKNIPSKIKIISLILLIMLILRYVSLILMFILQQLQKVYILRFTISLNIIAIPCILVLSYYIFLRKDGLKANFIFIILSILVCIYILIMRFVPISFVIHEVYGYLMIYSLNGWIEVTYILILSFILMFCIIGYGLKSSINGGITGVMFATMLLISEYILVLIGVNVDYNAIIGELVSLLVLKYAIETLRKA